MIFDVAGAALSLAPPLGPYTPVVKAGDLMFISAQSGIDPATKRVPSGDFEHECRQAFANLLGAVQSGGGAAQDVVKTTVLYIDPTDLATINAIYAEVFPDDPPARTCAIVQLVGGRRISIDAIAVASTAHHSFGGNA